MAGLCIQHQHASFGRHFADSIGNTGVFRHWLAPALQTLFRGTVGDGGGAGKGQIQVQGRTGMALRVDVSQAQGSYDESAAARARPAKANTTLVVGS
jgi:hypothetical protein